MTFLAGTIATKSFVAPKLIKPTAAQWRKPVGFDFVNILGAISDGDINTMVADFVDGEYQFINADFDKPITTIALTAWESTACDWKWSVKFNGTICDDARGIFSEKKTHYWSVPRSTGRVSVDTSGLNGRVQFFELEGWDYQ